ncbi:MAG TPA: protein translocase subunit SecD [Streptosporangiaceae bacterium]|nr:protein translocase subunit SecD [Streptosporangiaceae bacterium]
MNRAAAVRAVLALVVVALSAFFVVTKPPRLGLDLRGGTQIVLETSDSPTTKANAESTDRALEVLRRRVDSLGVSEPTLVRSGERRIVVELPDVQDPRQAAAVIGRTAQLTFHPVLGIEPPAQSPAPSPTPSPTQSTAQSPTRNPAASPAPSPGQSRQPTVIDPRREVVLADEGGERLRLGPAVLTGEGVGGADARTDPQQPGMGWFVTIDFRGGGGRAWEQVTGKAACQPPGDPRRRVAIVLDNEIISSPQVEESVQCNVGILGGSTQITGQFTPEEAQDLALLIKGGALPVPVQIIEQRTVGPSLGQAAIEASTKAAVIGVILTGLFIIAVYRLLGGMATVALAGYGLISYAALLALGATLTLPGLAGFVLAIGMAVDANVLVFERAREEYAAGRDKSLRRSLVGGFRGAVSAIADSNITTLLAAGLLFFLASGPVRGFGVTLSIGVLASMLSALVVTRVLAEWAVNRRVVRRHPKVTGMAGLGRVRSWLTRRRPNLMRRRRGWLAISAVAVVIAVGGIFVRGLNFGVEFTGGRLVEYSTSRPVDVDQARQSIAAAGFPRAVVQASDQDNITVRAERLTGDEQERIRAALSRDGGEATKLRDEFIGPSLGDELRRNALIALAIALAAQLAYLAIRFRWTFGAAAVAAMAHDVAILIGIFAWLGKPIDGVFLAALLTVIGYSVNDSVVVFDRIREHWRTRTRVSFADLANDAVLQTVPRTINTGLGAVFILTALLFLGGDSLADFALALLIGIAVGTYSSMFTATPLAIELHNRSAVPPPSGRTAGTGKVATRKPAKAARPGGDSGAVI